MVELLLCYGLTRQEAAIYHTLLSEGELTGYEAAKLTGISRSNTYGALAGLVEKGAAYITTGAVTKYTPVKLEEFCDNKLRSLKKMKKELLLKMPEKKPESSGYITIKGEQHIIDKMKNMLCDAKERIYISVSNRILKMVEEELKAAMNRSIKLVLITDESFEIKGAKQYLTQMKEYQIRLIVDSGKVLTGDMEEKEDATCLYSKNKNLVDVFKDMLQNEIKLSEIKLSELKQ